MKKTILAVIAIGALCGAAPAQTIFLSWNMPSVPTVSAAGPGDVNGDAFPDVAFGGGGLVKVWSGLSGALIWQVADGASNLGSSIANAGDVDLDGISDIVAAAPGTGTALGYTKILSGTNGAEIRTIPVATTTVHGGGDFDGDGVPDQLGTFVVPGGAPGQSGVHVFSGLTGNILHTVTDAWCNCSANVAAAFMGDLDGNGSDELAVSLTTMPFGGGLVAILAGPSPYVYALITNVNATWLTDVGDLTGDGKPEIGSSSSYLPNFDVFDVGAGGIIDGANYLWRYTAPIVIDNTVRVGNADGDGIPDSVISARSLPITLSTFATQRVLSGATGTLLTTTNAPGYSPSLGTRTFAAAAGDVNADGVPDFILAYRDNVQCAVRVVSSTVLTGSPTAPPLNLGGACGAGSPFLVASPLRLGMNWAVTLHYGLPFAAGDFVFDVSLPAPFSFGTCTWHLDLANVGSWLVLPVTINAAGSAAVAIPVPAIPSNLGLAVTLQAIVYGTASPLGLDISNGLKAVSGL